MNKILPNIRCIFPSNIHALLEYKQELTDLTIEHIKYENDLGAREDISPYVDSFNNDEEWLKLFKKYDETTIVIFDKDKVIGQCAYYFYDAYAVFFRFYIFEQYRNLGIGRYVIDQMKYICKWNDTKYIAYVLYNKNISAKKFYEKYNPVVIKLETRVKGAKCYEIEV